MDTRTVNLFLFSFFFKNHINVSSIVFFIHGDEHTHIYSSLANILNLNILVEQNELIMYLLLGFVQF